MKTTKSWKVILSPLQTYLQQVKEVRNALYIAREQLRQIPSYWVARVIILIVALLCSHFLVWSSWFVTWVSQDKTELHCRREVKAKNITPVFTCEKTLPRTGAN